MNRGISVELLKMRRSPVVMVATALMVVMIPLMGAAFVWVAENGGAGAIGQKAQALVVGDGWDGYFGIVHQIAAVAMFLGIGIVVAWVFGREHVDRTFPSLFALPVSRGAIAGAKIVVLVGWVIVLGLLITIVTVAVGLATVGSGDVDGVAGGALRQLAIVGLTGVLALTMAPVASAGRGYLPAIGAIIVTIAVAQIAVLFGSGAWLPFAVPGLLAVNGADGVPVPGIAHISLVLLLSGAALGATVRWWSRAEVG